jgi:hypothetical protein
MNEPETPSSLAASQGSCVSINGVLQFEPYDWLPLDRTVDSMVSSCYGGSLPPFWQIYGNSGNPPQRIHPYALAVAFFKIRAEAGASNTVLPGSSTADILGADYAGLNAQQTLSAVNSDANAGLYWQAFYDAVNSGLSTNCGSYTIPRDQLKALHIHQYDLNWLWNAPSFVDGGGISPLGFVAQNATKLRRAADWFRNRYNGGTAIPLDIFLSEFGPDWRIVYGPDEDRVTEEPSRTYYRQIWPRAWAGGWKGFKSGLSWWNSWLCWLTRIGPSECQLAGWDISSPQHTIHGCIHDPHMEPYATRDLVASPGNPNPWTVSNGVRDAVYFDVNTLSAISVPASMNREFIVVPGLVNEGRYRNSFTTWGTRSWGGNSWRLGPFAACLATWAAVGADDYRGGPLSTSWVFNSQSGIVGTVNLSFNECYPSTGTPYDHFYTVCVPIIKSSNSFAGNDQIYFQWQSSVNHGYMNLSDFAENATYNNINGYPSQTIYSAIVIPVLCRASISSPACPKTVQFSVIRQNASGGLWVGRPVVLPYGCSWLSDQ